ncbi:MAG: DUF6377 domain-containing protein, partial [Prevotellaceae bacterium]|nr:DUF6377 domain-containing protein [Prevotellaceae bacterium]
PFLDKSSKRAAEYAMACTENTKAYGDKGRSLDVVMANATITKAYEDKLQSKERTMTVAIGLLAISLVFIAFMLYLLIKKSHRLTIINDKLRDMGESLQKKIISEETIREELKESNMLLENELKYRNKSFIDVYRLASRYITDVENYKKSVFNLITAGKIDKARKELSSVSATEKYLQEFYAQFDKAFISSHPDFINRFNSLLKPECRIVPTPSTLTPELRIYALVSIGITDSVTIADFLHYSPQTIYNYRLRIRHNACIPEKNFAETVAKMYDDVNKSKIGGVKFKVPVFIKSINPIVSFANKYCRKKAIGLIPQLYSQVPYVIIDISHKFKLSP